MFPIKTKICGVTTASDAEMLGGVGVDAVGLNFYERSRRYVDPHLAGQIVAQLPITVKRVGVFVNASVDTIRQTIAAVGLDAVQLHGDEPPEYLGLLNDITVIRAFRCDGSLEPVRGYLERGPRAPDAVLVDAYDPHEYGGTGKSLHWPDVAEADRYVGQIPVILAGGLTPENVAQAIQDARPFGVDVASGVECSPGVKDADLCTRFVRSAMAAFST